MDLADWPVNHGRNPLPGAEGRHILQLLISNPGWHQQQLRVARAQPVPGGKQRAVWSDWLTDACLKSSNPEQSRQVQQDRTECLKQFRCACVWERETLTCTCCWSQTLSRHSECRSPAAPPRYGNVTSRDHLKERGEWEMNPESEEEEDFQKWNSWTSFVWFFVKTFILWTL